MYRIYKSIDIDFAHHVRGHQGACINIHGHTWKFEVGLEASELDPQGFVVDFGKLKSDVLNPCHAFLDHSFAIGAATYEDLKGNLEPVGVALLSSRETPDPNHEKKCPPLQLNGAEAHYPGGMKVAVFPFSPTSERIAKWLYELAVEKLEDGRVRVAFARIYETLHPVEAVAEFIPAPPIRAL